MERATDTLLQQPSSGDTGTTETDKLREINRLLTHKLKEAKLILANQDSTIIQQTEKLQEEEQRSRHFIRVQEDLYYISSIRIKESIDPDLFLDSSARQALENVHERIFTQQHPIQVDDWVRFQLSINVFSIGQVVEILTEDSLAIQLSSVVYHCKTSETLLKPHYTQDSEIPEHQPIFLGPPDLLYKSE